MNDAVSVEPTAQPRASDLRPSEVAAMLLVSVAMIAATAAEWWPISWAEVVGFITGGVCVWLAVREHLWTWPIGLANNVVFFALFWQGRLFADAGLQVVYFALGVYGWWQWRPGARQRAELPISHTPRFELFVLAAAVPFATWGLREILVEVQGAAPFWDALTTVLSLVAQFLMCRKRLENWLVWIITDAIYVPLYLSHEMSLTAVLYAVFLVMCVAGWFGWRARVRG
ncbi:nicotinamide riboside transporter PnuC [Fimbriiglobus ruber]|uniref:Nicotinamide riboside transporter PnuC n=1 Tax=Fimbriiglobus ruber TaxID=1908690 RepID=A0A225DFU5_9BACT|nr:nicotinamide riboside transporter PnuC [Fimbriiglobus ruber]OWK40441.1 putative membrane transporter [Fimbriiglobus ruber]